MSSLWSAEILAKDGRVVDVRVRQIHPDSGPFVASKVFALRLLYDEAYGYRPGLVREARGPLGQAIALEHTMDAAHMATHVDRFIERVEVQGAGEPPLDLESARAQVDRDLLSRGIRREEETAWNDAWDNAWRAFWRDGERLPTATYRITVSEPRWLAHLAVGQTWESAAYG
ncbi:hypothetical protein [Sorangium sp. So ce861]|uniref:hypothetical protein n=1 Tax=Sorangium sp. So ce861 TaxID=3133323 RepID=UPI003F62A3F7